MYPMLWPTLFAIAALLCLAIGVRGIVQGGDVARQRGSNTLMHYPGPFPWLNKTLTAARWVQWIGRLYLLAAIGLFTLSISLGMQQSSHPPNHTCQRIAQHLLSVTSAESSWTIKAMENATDSCQSTIVDVGGTRWFSIRSVKSNGLIGEDFRHQIREIERSGMAIKPISSLGQRAIIATPRTKGRANPTLIIQDALGVHRIEINGLRVDTSHRGEVVDIIRQALGSVSPEDR